MAAMQIRLSPTTVEETRAIAEKDFGFTESTDDKNIWTLILEYKRQKVVIENLEMRLRKCEEKKEQVK